MKNIKEQLTVAGGALGILYLVYKLRKANGRAKAEIASEPKPILNRSTLEVEFSKFDSANKGTISYQDFRKVSDNLQLGLNDAELQRVFKSVDRDNNGTLNFEEFYRGIRRSSLLNKMVNSLQRDIDFKVAEDYDFKVATTKAYCHPDYVGDSKYGTSTTKNYDEAKHGGLYGDFVDIRRSLDFSYHPNYTRERQLWQDEVVRRAADHRTKPTQHPWIVFTCGAMGVGKGYTVNYLSEKNFFPLETLVHIDPDHFKQVMPEWQGYVKTDSKQAGTLCHKESGYLQELATEVALRGSQNLWIDGSLGDHEWYTSVFRDIRKRYPQYRLAILYVYASEEEVFKRAEKRGQQTGRFVPKEKLSESMAKTRKSIEVLGPQVEFLCKLSNEGKVPDLEVCESRMHDFKVLNTNFQLRDISRNHSFCVCPEMRESIRKDKDT